MNNRINEYQLFFSLRNAVLLWISGEMERKLCCNSRHCPHRLRLQDDGGIKGSEVVGSEDKR